MRGFMSCCELSLVGWYLLGRVLLVQNELEADGAKEEEEWELDSLQPREQSPREGINISSTVFASRA